MELPFVNVSQIDILGGSLFCAAAAALLFLFVLHQWLPLCRRKPAHLPSLEGKHVLISGGSGGIGIALAKECLSQGASVSLIGRSSARLLRAATSLAESCSLPSSSLQHRILLKAADVSDAGAISAAIMECFNWKPIDVLICNAGVTVTGLFGEMDVQDIEQVARTNFLGCVCAVHAALPLMKARSRHHRSSVVLVSSLSGMLFLTYGNVYSATKYAIKGLAEMLRFELMPYSMKVSLVCPGFVETGMLDMAENAGHEQAKLLRRLHFYDRGKAQSAEAVARKAMEGVKEGEFLITTCPAGFLIGVLGRGAIPAESCLRACIELLLMVPLRIVSFCWYAYLKKVVREVQQQQT